MTASGDYRCVHCGEGYSRDQLQEMEASDSRSRDCVDITCDLCRHSMTVNCRWLDEGEDEQGQDTEIREDCRMSEYTVGIITTNEKQWNELCGLAKIHGWSPWGSSDRHNERAPIFLLSGDGEMEYVSSSSPERHSDCNYVAFADRYDWLPCLKGEQPKEQPQEQPRKPKPEPIAELEMAREQLTGKIEAVGSRIAKLDEYLAPEVLKAKRNERGRLRTALGKLNKAKGELE